MAVWNAITDTVLLSIKRCGPSNFTAGAGETLYTNVGRPPSGMSVSWDAKKYYKMESGAIVLMEPSEMTVVDLAAASSDLANSESTYALGNVYADVVSLPETPRENGLVVMIGDTGSGDPGLALSDGGVWRISTFS